MRRLLAGVAAAALLALGLPPATAEAAPVQTQGAPVTACPASTVQTPVNGGFIFTALDQYGNVCIREPYTLNGDGGVPSHVTNFPATQPVSNAGAFAVQDATTETNTGTVATAQGAQGTGYNPPSGGSGILGFLSGVYHALTNTLTMQGPAAEGGAVSNGFMVGVEQAGGTVQYNWGDPAVNSATACLRCGAVGPMLVDNNAGVLTNFMGQEADYRSRTVSAANTSTALTIDLLNLHDTLSIEGVCSSGTGTLVVAGSADNTNFLTLDSLSAASPQTKQYTATTVGATLALSPLAFRYIQITMGACGASNTSTLTVSAK